MPRVRVGSGVGTAGRRTIKLRGFAGLFSDLPPAAALRLEDAFADAEDLFDQYQLPTPQRENRRRFNAAVEVPRPVAESSIIGGSVRWDALRDPRVIMYDVQISDNNIFSSPTESQVLEPFVAFENIVTRKFIRVRGILFGGISGNFSETVILDPIITAPIAESVEFYIAYEKSLPETMFAKVYGANKGPDFYTVFTHDFYMNRQIGGRSLWGSHSARLKDFRNSDILPWDKVRVLINGESIQEQDYALWTQDPFYSPLLSFYGLGGYTAGWGPFFVPYPANVLADGHNSVHRAVNFYGTAGGINFYGANEGAIGQPWHQTSKVRFTTRLDQGDPNVISQFEGGLGEVADEAYAFDLARQEATTFLKCQDFRFTIPSNTNISGIELQVKRRQLNIDIDTIGDDLGNADSLHNIQTHGQNVDTNDIVIVEDIKVPALNRDFSRSIDFNGTNELLQGPRRVDPDALPLDMTTGNLTWTGWIFSKTATFIASTPLLLFSAGSTAVNGSWSVSLTAIGDPDRLRVTVTSRDLVPTTGVRTVEYDNNIALQVDIMNHIAVTWDGSDIQLYTNGNPITPTRIIADAVDPTLIFNASADVTVSGREGLPDEYVPSIMSQIGMWDKVLTEDEINDIVDSGYEIDLRFPRGAYQSQANLKHYWLHLLDPPDIIDSEIFVIDKDGDVRTDLDNKALAQSWPKLANFNADGTSDGIPHDHPIGIGYQGYGGTTDLWGLGGITDADVNSEDFGVAISCKNREGRTIGTACIDNVQMAVYYNDFYRDFIRVQVQAQGLNHFYLEREVFGSIINSIEVGERLFTPAPEDC